MKSFAFIYLLLLSISEYSQNQNGIDSLSNYSYFIFGNTSEKSIHQGTVFFVRKNEKIYLVTAAHNFNGWNYTKNLCTSCPYLDTLYLRVYRKDNGIAEFLTIDISRLKLSIPKGFISETPDLYFYEIAFPDTYKLFTIEKLFTKSINPHKNEEILTYGYPVIDEENDPYKYIRLPATKGIGNLLVDYPKKTRWHYDNGDIKGIDTISYHVIIKNHTIREGNSGSPCYLIDTKLKQGGNTKSVSFAGMLYGANFIDNTATLLRPEFIISIFNKL